MNSPKTMHKLLGRQNSEVAGLVTHARLLQRLNRRLQDALPETLAGHCQLANIHQQTLVLVVNSPAWATRFRMESHNLLNIIKGLKDFKDMREIRLKVVPPAPPKLRTETAANRPSARARQAIAASAALADDTELQAALARLARHSSDKNNKAE